jgi:hypothetical protein
VKMLFYWLIKYKTNENQGLSATLHLGHVNKIILKSVLTKFEKDYLVKINIFELKSRIQ